MPPELVESPAKRVAKPSITLLTGVLGPAVADGVVSLPEPVVVLPVRGDVGTPAALNTGVTASIIAFAASEKGVDVLEGNTLESPLGTPGN